MRCSNCGAPRGRSDAFCPRCGWHFDGKASRQVIIPSLRAVTPYRLDRAVLIGGATTAGLSAAWLAARWLLPRLADAVGRRLTRRPQVPARTVATDGNIQVETIVWMRRVSIRHK